MSRLLRIAQTVATLAAVWALLRLTRIAVRKDEADIVVCLCGTICTLLASVAYRNTNTKVATCNDHPKESPTQADPEGEADTEDFGPRPVG